MKLLKTLSVMGLTLAALSTATVIAVIQPAKADLFCYPWERGCKVDGTVGTSGNNLVGGARDGFVISVENKTGTTIWVDVRAYYQEKLRENCAGVGGASCNDPYWRNFGTWKFSPGQKGLILNGSDGVIGRNATFKARSSDGRVWEKQVDMGKNIGSFTMTFR
ncbi:hypothetical protein [Calothrix sp. PCC 7507]|uniref:hypothetical protein n=1 Tax=Calothrix sp. PCC 7507 TaxID=99598 RepID=UPI00029F45F6|nr:hypothetical protein [Calothrix sp. PCC 7507]AFY31169.1 hypothetical protein Cal7507_0680 [Calothrix sp. PCC 7507]